jgi:glycosyltransferase involved in cell wall biosynthesis
MKIRVLRVITRLNVGGPAKQVFILQTEIPSTLFHQKIIVGKIARGESEVDLKPYGDLIQIPSLQRGISLRADFSAIKQISKVICEYKPEIIHTHLSKAWVISILAKKVSRHECISIHTFHGHILHSYFGKTANFVLTKVQNFFAAKTDLFIAVGERVRDEIVAAGITTQEKIQVVYPGILDKKSVEGESRQVNEGVVRLLFVGRLEPIKQPKLLLEICEMLQTLDILYELTVVGDGSLSHELRRISNLKNLNVRFEGVQTALASYYASHDVLLICSTNEGTPLVIIEASQNSLPVMSTAVGSIPDMIENNVTGFLVQNSVEAFVNKLIELDNDRLFLLKVGENARASFREKYMKEDFLRKHIDSYLL